MTPKEKENLIERIERLSYYKESLSMLDQYDKGTLPSKQNKEEAIPIGYDEALFIIGDLKKEFLSDTYFGREKSGVFKGILESVHQSFQGEDLYPSIEEKAAHLLYFIVKNHPFTDGNKRIGTVMFLTFLDKNNRLKDDTGNYIFDKKAIVSIALLIAESPAEQKDNITKLVVQMTTGVKQELKEKKDIDKSSSLGMKF